MFRRTGMYKICLNGICSQLVMSHLIYQQHFNLKIVCATRVSLTYQLEFRTRVAPSERLRTFKKFWSVWSAKLVKVYRCVAKHSFFNLRSYHEEFHPPRVPGRDDITGKLPQHIFKTRVSEPACFGALPAPGIFFLELDPAPEDIVFFAHFLKC